MFGISLEELPIYLMRIPCILIALAFHESAHGWMAYKLGDPTARSLGRLSMNPLKHLDPIGALMMILVGFGWAKPVPVNARYFKNPKRDMALTAIAGPISNLILGFFGTLLYMIFSNLYINAVYSGAGSLMQTVLYVLLLFCMVFMSLNISLAIFNLIPVPPLDGSRLLFIFLPDKYYFKLMQYERYISLIFMLLLIFDIITLPLGYAVTAIQNLFIRIWGFLPFL
ncbi:MAG: site-2 protease family protein [Clostridia bacterium]|nr:site-2 protease family protein [Clostridia bacterium]